MSKENKKIVIELETYATFNNKSVKLNDLLKELLTENENYKSKIDKAIEYINDDLKDYQTISSGSANDLLKILKGENNEN